MEILDEIIAWMQKEDAVRAVLLTGSRAISDNDNIDKFSDFDVALFVADRQKFLSDDAWINMFGKVCVLIPEQITFNKFDVPTRLVIFEGGAGVDFALWSTEQLAKLVEQKQLPFACENGYRILLDKDGLAEQLSKNPQEAQHFVPPTSQEFTATINIFFFEAFNCAKYLARGDLWHAKLRDWNTKEQFLKILEWYHKMLHGMQYKTYWHGKHMRSWADKEIWVDLNNCFAHFDAEDSWKSLAATIDLFRHVAKQTAEHLGYQYPADVDKNITEFVQKIRHGRAENANSD